VDYLNSSRVDEKKLQKKNILPCHSVADCRKKYFLKISCWCTFKKPQQSDSPFLPTEQNVLEPGSLEIEVMWFVDDVNVFSETFQVLRSM
jgi:hypothetical protein